jgi:hypothetical protein
MLSLRPPLATRPGRSPCRHRGRLGAILLWALLAAAGRGAIWVAPNGDDRNPGTEDRPCRTLAGARDLVRAVNRAMTDDITVFIGDGTYRLTEPLRLTGEDSGTADYAVIYTAAPGAHPIISGGAAGAPALIVGEGTAAQPLLNLVFKGLRFTGAAGPGGSVCFRHDRGLQFMEDEFVHLGGAALVLGRDSQGAAVTGCVFTDIGGSGLVVGEAADRAPAGASAGPRGPAKTTAHAESADNRIEDNHFFDVGEKDDTASALAVSHARRTRIAHNQIDHVPAAAIALAADANDPGNEILLNRIEETGEPETTPSPGAGLEPAYQAILRLHFSPPAPPAPPRRLAGVAQDGAVYLTWSPPGFVGGSPVAAYAVLAEGGERTEVTAAAFRAAGFVRIGGLANGTPVRFTVTALNALGASAPSLASAWLTPTHRRRVKPPGPPSAVVVQRQGDRAALQFSAPAADGGGPVLSYSMTLLPEGRRTLLAGRPYLSFPARPGFAALIEHLPRQGPVSVSIAAANAAGAGPAITLKVK